MKHRFRFFGEATSSQEWKIAEADQIHIKKVLKLNVGDEVEVCEGNGAWAIGKLSLRGGNYFVEETQRHDEPKPKPVIVMLGALKHGDFDDLIAPLTEVGVTEIKLFLQPGSEKSRINEKSISRWDKLAIAAIKQAKCPFRMQIQSYATLQDALEDLNDSDLGKFYLEPHQDSLLDRPSAAQKGIVLAIGSEKGLLADEVKRLDTADFKPASIGPHILRAKTAAVLAGGLGALLALNSN